MLRTDVNGTTVVSALSARANFGKLLRLAAPVPEVLRVIGEESRKKGTDKLTSRQIDRVIKPARAGKSKRG